eukprot:9231257-Alexandrium_andersonii.AAC.1
MTSGLGVEEHHGLLPRGALQERVEVHLREEDLVLGALTPAIADPVHGMGSVCVPPMPSDSHP